jgi:hypothetical protein
MNDDDDDDDDEHISGIIMPIIRRTRVCTAAYGVLHWL